MNKRQANSQADQRYLMFSQHYVVIHNPEDYNEIFNNEGYKVLTLANYNKSYQDFDIYYRTDV